MASRGPNYKFEPTAPGNWYNYNRYGYCLNNPLMYNDPSGEIIGFLLAIWAGNYLINSVAYAINNNTSLKTAFKATPIVGGVGFSPTGFVTGQSNMGFSHPQLDAHLAVKNEIRVSRELDNFIAANRMGESITSGNLAYQNAMVSEGIRNSVSMLPPAGQGPNWVPQGQGGSLGGWAAVAKDAASELYYSEKFGTWMGKNFTLYKQTWGGNGVTGGKLKFAKKTSTGIKIGGYAIAAYNAYSVNEQYRNGEISNGWMVTEQISNVYSTFGGLYGAAWGLGWELGRTITNTEWYQEAKFNFWYNYWESKVGSPSQSNENMWIYFYQNYKP